jgi:hypothetical protein
MSDDNVDRETFPLRFRDSARDEHVVSPEVGITADFSK